MFCLQPDGAFEKGLYCCGSGKRRSGGSLRASCPPIGVLRAEVIVDGCKRKGLVDTGCSFTLVSTAVSRERCVSNDGVWLETMNGNRLKTLGSCHVDSLVVGGKELGPRKVQVLQSLPLRVDVILGLDLVLDHGLRVFSSTGSVQVQFAPDSQFVSRRLGEAFSSQDSALVGNANEASESKLRQSLKVCDKDFTANFDGAHWTVSWRWSQNPPVCCKRPNYIVPEADRAAFDEEIQTWVDEGILVPWVEAEHGQVKNVVPLMSVHQVKGGQHKVRPVFDLRQLNNYVACMSGGTPTCDERIREWRCLGENGAVIDLKRAYLQVHVEKSLWAYQAVRWGDCTYLLTRLGFGMNVAPRVMTAIVEKVLGFDDGIRASSSSYIDDIFVTGGICEVKRVRKHLERFGLVTKQAEHLGMGTSVRVLGLSVDKQLNWSRDSKLPTVPKQGLTRRVLHSWIGELLGHYPVANWLRVACGYLQRCTAAEKIGWDNKVSDETRAKVEDVVAKLQAQGDPARGSWPVNLQQPAVLWADASSVGIGVALEIGGSIVEDAAWLRKANDSAHINMSELDAVIRGVNLCLRWGVRRFTVKTDSATVFGWLKSVFERTHRVKTHALGEMLVRRRLELLSELAAQECLEVIVERVASVFNKADALTRVPKKWLSQSPTLDSPNDAMGLAAPGGHIEGADHTRLEVARIHERHHFGVDRTCELARQCLGQHITRRLVKAVVSECRQCAMIDPAVNFNWQKGTLATSVVWQRLALDITHVGGRPFLSCIDCCSRFTIWRLLKDESAKEVSTHLARIFAEMGPPEEVFTDNGTVFRATELRNLCDVWAIKADYSCAYRAQGNGLIERIHRTIKRMVARSGRSIEEMAFWYNATRSERSASPFEMMFGAKPRMPGVTDRRQEVERTWPATLQAANDTRSDVERNPFVVGDQVFLKTDSRCDKPWSGPHRVTEIRSSVSVALDGLDIPRHVSHIRRVPVPCGAGAEQPLAGDTDDELDDVEDGVGGQQAARYPLRQRVTQQRYGMADVTEPIYR